MKYSSRFWLYAPLGLFLTLAAGVMIHWWLVASAFDTKLKAVNGRQAIPGITLAYDSVTISGFPFRLDAMFTNLRVQGMAAHGPFAWSSEKFAMHSLAYGPTKDIFEAAGQQTLVWSNGAGDVHRIAFLPGSLHASAAIDRSGLARFDVDAVATEGPGFTAARVQFHMRRDPDGQDLDLMTSGDQIKMGPARNPTVLNWSVYSTLTHASAFAGLMRGEESWQKAAAAWRAAGGQAKPGPTKITPKVADPQNAGASFFGPLY